MAIAVQADAAAPVGDVVADARQPAVVDAAGARAAFDLDGRTVRILDLAGGASRDVDVSGACTPAPQSWRLVVAIGGGAVLLHCDDRREQRIVPRVLVEADTVVKAPAGFGVAWRDLPTGMTPDGRLLSVYSNSKTPPTYTAIDWRTGDRQPWSGMIQCSDWALAGGTDGLSLVRCHGSERVSVPYASAFAHGFASWSGSNAVGVGLPDCRASLRWDVDGLAAVAHLPGAALISVPLENEMWSITRVPLVGVCERTVVGWGLRASARGRVVSPQMTQADVPDPKTGATVALLSTPPRRPASLRVRPGGMVLVHAEASARSLHWRIDGWRWVRARRAHERWVVPMPGRLRPRATLQTKLTLAAGGTVSHVLRLAPQRRR